MADSFRGIGHIGPAYPVKPVEPAGKDRPSGEKRRKPAERPHDETNEPESDEQQKGGRGGKIDEYI